MVLAWPDVHSFGPVRVLLGHDGGRYPSGNVMFVDGGQPTVVDPMSRPACEAVASAARVELLYNSHFHEDHRQGNDLFPDAGLYVPEQERIGYDDVRGFGALYGWDMSESNHDHTGWLDRYPGMRRTDVAGTFAFGDRKTWGEVPVEFVGLPGHSPGHSGFFFPEQRVMYVGDIDFTKFGPWYGSASSDIDAFLETLETLAAYVERVDAFITAHERGVVSGDLEREVEVYRGVIRARDHRLLEYVDRAPRTWDDILRQEIVFFYPAKARGYVAQDDRTMIRMHLDRLVAAGIVRADGEHYLLAHRTAPAN